MKPSLNSYHVPKLRQVQGGEEMPNIHTKQHFQNFISCTHTKIIIHFLCFNKPKKTLKNATRNFLDLKPKIFKSSLKFLLLETQKSFHLKTK